MENGGMKYAWRNQMKILMTGMTRRQANLVSSSSKQDYLTAPIIFYNILKKIEGVKVDWRPITYGEDLKAYDIVLIGLATPNSLSNIFLFQSLWATNYPHLFFVDDFQVKGCFSRLDSYNIFRDFTFGRQKLNVDERKNLMRIPTRVRIEKLAKNILNASHLLAPMFEWGQHSLLLEGTPIMEGGLEFIDPSPFVTNINDVNMSKKERKWICPALYDYSDKLTRWNITWPVDYYHKKNYISEHELEKECVTAYGILSPKYSHAGSGWWRNRFNMAINTRSLLIAHQDEVKGLGKMYDTLRNLRQIENASTKQLNALVEGQRHEFFKNMESKKYNIQKMEGIVSDAIMRWGS